MARARIEDVADMAGVSVATVNRVLSGRDQVRPQNAKRVEMAIRALNFQPDRLAARLAKRRDYRFCFILPHGKNIFMQGLEHEIAKHAKHIAVERVNADVRYADVFEPLALAQALQDLTGYDGVAVVAMDHPLVREAIAQLHAKGIAVVTLVSDVPGSARTHYVGIDNCAAGRTAATLLGRYVSGTPGCVAVLAGSLSLRDHAERHFGFMQVMNQEFANLSILPVCEGRDDAAQNQNLVAALLKAQPDVVAIYNIGSGTEGILQALHNAKKKLIFIAHELNGVTRKGLIDGDVAAVIAQDPGHEIRSAMRVLMAKCDQVPIVAAMERISIDIFIRDNLP
jgi:LacI family transcriptional regulator